jgi:VanZ family protein
MCASFYGLTDEFHQRFTVHRSCDIHDWYADTLGACVVFLTAFLRPKGPPPV